MAASARSRSRNYTVIQFDVQLVDVSPLEYRHGSESLKPVGAKRKHDGQALLPALASSRVLHSKAAIAHQRFDSRPLASRRDPRSQVTPRLDHRRVITPRLREHAASAQHPSAGAQAIAGEFVLNGADAFTQLGEHLGCGTELGGNRKRHLEHLGHGTIGATYSIRGG